MHKYSICTVLAYAYKHSNLYNTVFKGLRPTPGQGPNMRAGGADLGPMLPPLDPMLAHLRRMLTCSQPGARTQVIVFMPVCRSLNVQSPTGSDTKDCMAQSLLPSRMQEKAGAVSLHICQVTDKNRDFEVSIDLGPHPEFFVKSSISIGFSMINHPYRGFHGHGGAKHYLENS